MKKIERIYSVNHETTVFKYGRLFWASDGRILKSNGKKKVKCWDFNTEKFNYIDDYDLEDDKDANFKMKWIGGYEYMFDPLDIKYWKKINK